MTKSLNLSGKAALISGAGGGICRAIAVAFAEAGADVACVDIDVTAAAQTARLVEAAGRKAMARRCNVADEDDVIATTRAAHDALGRLDILVSGAAPHDPAGTVIEVGLADWQRVLDINLTGAFLFSQAAGRDMLRRQWGRIINVASISGLHASVNGPHYAPYAATKAGLMGLTRELAASWGRKGIRVNAIAPGFFHSRLADGAIEFAEPAIKASAPIPRVGAEGELKGVAVFLAADASNYITGQTIVVDGGRTIA